MASSSKSGRMSNVPTAQWIFDRYLFSEWMRHKANINRFMIIEIFPFLKWGLGHISDKSSGSRTQEHSTLREKNEWDKNQKLFWSVSLVGDNRSHSLKFKQKRFITDCHWPYLNTSTVPAIVPLVPPLMLSIGLVRDWAWNSATAVPDTLCIPNL